MTSETQHIIDTHILGFPFICVSLMYLESVFSNVFLYVLLAAEGGEMPIPQLV